jgi:hypothetical protein
MRSQHFCRLWLLSVFLLLLGGGACADLNVPNPNEPDKDRTLRTPADIETLIGGTFLLWWQVNHGLGTSAETRPSAAVGALSALGEEVTASGAHYGIQDIGRRPPAPIINDPGSSWHPYVQGTWQEYYKIISAARVALIAMQDPNFKLGANGQDNGRLKTSAKFMQGMAHCSLGYTYREAYILDESVTDEQLRTLKLQPYADVMAVGLSELEEAGSLAAANTFTIPSAWMGNVTYTNQDLVKITNSYRARFTAGVARNPRERAAVDWAKVLQLAQTGFTTDFGVQADGPGGKWKADIILATGASSSSGGGRRIHHDIIGPADTTGAWQKWKASNYTQQREITIATPDRRIHGAGGPTTPGTQVKWFPTSGMAESRGLYYFSLYADLKWRAYRDTEFGFLVDFAARELNFLKAEALIQLGRLQEAADQINLTRVPYGRLPPVTVTGVSGPSCVPRTPTGACGTLLDALKYEKGLELWLTGSGVRLSDRRGWGDQFPGLAIHLPVPKNELTLAGLPFYTTGGIGGIDAAP